ncbi:MAG: TetR family transcriptional regulator C-terminal domain-containing protein [Bacteroidia bacterium]|nr:TetR family transcriptional regulator C-terminal domain-containing protein [Bacteroidia bacterium]
MATKAKEVSLETRILELYKQLVVEGKIKKMSVFSFCKALDISEADFYKHFASLDAVGRKIWTSYAEEVLAALKGSETYQNYSAREKILAYFFTFFETVVKDRSFISKTYTNFSLLRGYQRKFRTHMAEVIQEGVIADEIQSRHLENLYLDVLWGIHWGLIQFWLNDESEGFQDTEKAIETYLRIPLELMGQNVLDSAYEALRFTLNRLKIPKITILS